MSSRAPETRRVRPQAGAASGDAPGEGPVLAGRMMRNRPVAPASVASVTPAGRPMRAPAATAAAASTGAARPERRPVPVAAAAPLVVFGPRSAAAKDAFYGPMAEVMTELYDVLHKEIAALDAGELDTLEVLRLRKEGLASIYLESLVNLRKDELLKARLGEVDRESLRQAADTLRTATAENMRRLKARIESVSGVIEAVIEAVRNGGEKTLKVYEQNGTIGGIERPTSRLGLDTAL